MTVYYTGASNPHQLKSSYATSTTCSQDICFTVSQLTGTATYAIRDEHGTRLDSSTITSTGQVCLAISGANSNSLEISLAMQSGSSMTITDFELTETCDETVLVANVKSYQNYYPFGMTMHNRRGEDLGGEYRYGFNGMEQDDEVAGANNSYTTEFRQNDPRIGRWLSMDPKSMKFPWQSPYVSMDNKPQVLVDPLGTNTIDKGKNLASDEGLASGEQASEEDLAMQGKWNSFNSDGTSRKSDMLVDLDLNQLSAEEVVFAVFYNSRVTKNYQERRRPGRDTVSIRQALITTFKTGWDGSFNYRFNGSLKLSDNTNSPTFGVRGNLNALEPTSVGGPFDPATGAPSLGNVTASAPAITTTTSATGTTQLTITQNVTIQVFIGTGSFTFSTTNIYTENRDASGSVIEGGRRLSNNGDNLAIRLSHISGGDINSVYQRHSAIQAFQSLVR